MYVHKVDPDWMNFIAQTADQHNTLKKAEDFIELCTQVHKCLPVEPQVPDCPEFIITIIH